MMNSSRRNIIASASAAVAAALVSLLNRRSEGGEEKPRRDVSGGEKVGLIKNVEQLNARIDLLSKLSPPVGTVVMFVGSKPPEGWLLCDGAVLDMENSDFAELAKLLGTAFDPEKKSVRLPRMQGRTAIGAGGGTDGISERKLGDLGGCETHALTIEEMPTHSHVVNDPGHAHQAIIKRKGADNFEGDALFSGRKDGDDPKKNDTQGRGTSKESTCITIAPAGESKPHNNMQPFVVLNYIIKYKAIPWSA